MWRKIHSNRDPRDTLYNEVRKEFGTYFAAAGNAFGQLAAAYPKFVFGCMIFLMALSLGLSFTIFRHPDKQVAPIVKKVNPVADGFNRIIQATGQIRETLYLRKLVDSISNKTRLDTRDSTLLDSALDQLSQIHPTQK